MSTFDGIIREIPDIRVDFFRQNPNRRPPLACFLSHVHSDHLAGLESLRSPFVYCSAPTRELLLRLERYPCRINYANGILEARVQTYKHLKNLLKPIPLETPTTIELEPGRRLRVTLFDANHCTGAVMFLFEGDGKAVVYTGDIRSEPWHISATARSPCLLEYSCGIKTLDRIYLDTSFIDDTQFPPKADGIRELLRKVAQYPDDTVFHFRAWTFGYEAVWIALAKALRSQIHVDSYKLGLYRSLAPKDRNMALFHMGPEVPALVGFMCGNTPHPGCLTDDETVRLHSCEKGNQCTTARDPQVVHIVPIITRLPDGSEVAEAGVGGGGVDLEREAELDPSSVQDFLDALSHYAGISEEAKAKIAELVETSITTGRNASLDIDISSFDDNNQTDLASALERSMKPSGQGGYAVPNVSVTVGGARSLPKTITFPYSRHSSYSELCHLVETFKPRDVWPCTAHPAEWIKHGINIRSLFGHCCSGEAFEYDSRLSELASRLQVKRSETQETQATRKSDADVLEDLLDAPLTVASSTGMLFGDVGSVKHTSEAITTLSTNTGHKRNFAEYAEIVYRTADQIVGGDEKVGQTDSQDSTTSDVALQIRRAAFEAATGNMTVGEHMPIGLLSATDNHARPDIELGMARKPGRQLLFEK
ncbi:hypothetical protein RB596_002093 [Gaeumannomyces avenae]